MGRPAFFGGAMNPGQRFCHVLSCTLSGTNWFQNGTKQCDFLDHSHISQHEQKIGGVAWWCCLHEQPALKHHGSRYQKCGAYPVFASLSC